MKMILFCLSLLVLAGCAPKDYYPPGIEGEQYRKVSEIINSPNCTVQSVDKIREQLTYTCDKFGSVTKTIWYPTQAGRPAVEDRSIGFKE